MPYFLWLLLLLFSFAPLRPAQAGNFYAGTSPTNVPWPGGIVPYQFTNTLTPEQEETYLDGLREWELAANVKFVPYTNQTRWILFCYDTNFLDYVAGGSYSPQIITVSSLSRAQVCHEMGHSFGFTHENIRPDTTNYIQVLANNITNEVTNIYWFTIDPTSVTNGKYDYESVMHLGWDFDSINPGVLATQQPRPPNFPRYQYRMGNYCLSPGDRAALAYLYGPPAVPLTNIVTTTADVGPGSLRAALYYVTDHPGSVVTFNIPTSDLGYSNGVFNIHLTGMLPPLVSNGMVIDGSTQPGFAGKPLIVVDGSQILPETYTSDTGLLVYSSSNQVKDVSFSGFNWNGLTFTYADASNNVVSGCWIGVDRTGTNPAPNAYQGILVTSGSAHNTFGGTTPAARNVISGNSQYGIYIGGTNTGGNLIEGNYIGTDPSGSIAVPNGLSGVFIGGTTTGNTIGGASAGARNVLSGNDQYGVWISDTNTTGNIVAGNYIGTDATGSNAIPNQASGVFMGGSSGENTVSDNVISGNDGYGIFVTNTIDNIISGNYIGPDAAGTNSPGVQTYGIGVLTSTSGNVIGGTSAGAGNVLSGNTAYGIFIQGPDASGNVVEGNLIGTDSTGTNALPNGGWGIGIWNDANSNVIGGTTPAARNVISGNTGAGYGIAIGTANSNVVEGNYIGTDVSGKLPVPNSFAGLAVESGSVGNVIGGTAAGAGNVIDYNYIGVAVYQSNTTNNAIRGDSIFDNTWLGIDLDGFPGDHVGFEAGPNDWQNYPVITNAFGYGGSTIVQGNFNSLPNDTYFIDFYVNSVEESYGYGQGQVYIGSKTVTTSGAGNALFAYTNSSANYAGQYISATATAATGDSSEFAADVLATNAPAPSGQFGAPFRWLTNGFVFNLTLATNFSYHVQTTTNLAANPVPWINLTNFIATNISITFTDRAASSYRARFYRIVSP
ncbi:MAG TPA: M12 family metallopeptidase [Alphaproteobacteria bacterium]|nr:M12 family metallopeptidase [Alphaproteobacteria bacterium]